MRVSFFQKIALMGVAAGALTGFCIYEAGKAVSAGVDEWENETRVTATAAHDWSCPVDAVSAKLTDPTHATVGGCGHQDTYVKQPAGNWESFSAGNRR